MQAVRVRDDLASGALAHSAHAQLCIGDGKRHAWASLSPGLGLHWHLGQRLESCGWLLLIILAVVRT